MSDMNSVCIIGRLTRDPELKYSSSGTPFCKFSIANNVYQGKGKDEKVNFFNITVFGKMGENCDKYLRKGSQALIEGKMDHNIWTDESGEKKSSIGIIANSVQFVGKKAEGTGNSFSDNNQPPSDYPPESPPQSEPSQAPAPDSMFNEPPIDDTDDIPF
jgi:single-strand DNA-binding protein